MTAHVPLPDRSDTGDPSAQGGTIGALVAAVLALLASSGLPLTGEQTAAILAVVAVAAPPLTALLIRRRAWAPASVAAAIDAELADDTGLLHSTPPYLYGTGGNVPGPVTPPRIPGRPPEVG